MSLREYLKTYFESELYIEWVYLIFRSDYYLSRSRKIKFRDAWRTSFIFRYFGLGMKMAWSSAKLFAKALNF